VVKVYLTESPCFYAFLYLCLKDGVHDLVDYREMMCTPSLLGKKESRWGQQLNMESLTADLNRAEREREREREMAEEGKFSEKR